MATRDDEIELGFVNGYGPRGDAPTRAVRYDDNVVDIVDRPYLNSHGNLHDPFDDSDAESEHIDLTEELPSRQIQSLTYKNLDGTIRRRTTSAAKAKIHRPTHLYNKWREEPNLLFEQILSAWREQDAQEAEELDAAQEVTTNKRIEELREMTINLQTKIRLRDALRKATIRRRQGARKVKGISAWKNMKYSLAIKWEHLKSFMSKTFSSMGLWEGHLKAFAGHFGTDVTAYFLFLRWLFVANVIIGLLILVFLFVPNTLSTFASTSETNEVVVISLSDTNRSVQNSRYTPLQNAVELLIGKAPNSNSTGCFENTGMYYGDYDSRNITSIGSHISYNMQLAYLISYFIYFLVYFLVLAISVAKSYRTNFVESNDKFTFQYVLNILDGWDYVVDSAKTAETKKKNKFRDFKEFCWGKREPESDVNFADSLMLFMFRAGAVVVMLIFIALSGFGVYALERDQHAENVWLRDLGGPTIITAINSIVPFLFTIISSFLKFTYQKSVVYLSLVMTMFLYGATLGVYFFVAMFPCGSEGNFKCELEGCWETRLGTKAYTLVVIDFLFGIIISLVAEVLYRLVAQFCCQRWEAQQKEEQEGHSIYPQFDIARNTMAIIYNQFLLWLGIYYSPLLTVVVVIKLWITFYFKRVTVMNSCIPTTKPWRAAKMHTVFLGLLFIGFIVCIVAFTAAVAVVSPSTTCGPFMGLKKPSDIIQSAIGEADHMVTNIVLSPGVVVGVIVVLCVIVHYVRVTSSGRQTLISLLKIQITLESKDKAYLRHMLEEVQKHKNNRREMREACRCIGACHCGQVNHSNGDAIAPRQRVIFYDVSR
ncbi:transmembrane channel-like protein 7 isoform X2 [Watersipora subatra]|uniref:transmembrane channel-like protein 7 isoform X2 n=1 Tax=Watersipora subatra TaxID=2589382 RepID=UPI00355AD21E